MNAALDILEIFVSVFMQVSSGLFNGAVKAIPAFWELKNTLAIFSPESVVAMFLGVSPILVKAVSFLIKITKKI